MSDFLVVCLYVDDMIYTGSCKTLAAEFKSCMMKEFEMSYLGIMQYFLGLQVKHEEDGIFVSQRKYAKDLLLRFGMQNCKVAATPMNANEKLQLEYGIDPADPSLLQKFDWRFELPNTHVLILCFRLVCYLSICIVLRSNILVLLKGFCDMLLGPLTLGFGTLKMQTSA